MSMTASGRYIPIPYEADGLCVGIDDGERCVSYVAYHFSPGERQTWHHPAMPPDYEVVYAKTEDGEELTEEELERYEDALIEAIQDHELALAEEAEDFRTGARWL